MPPASGLAFEVSLPARPRALLQQAGQCETEDRRSQIATQNRRFIHVLAPILESGEDRHPPHLSSRCVARIVRVLAMPEGIH